LKQFLVRILKKRKPNCSHWAARLYRHQAAFTYAAWLWWSWELSP